MPTTGIIAEYNPFHRGHMWQIAEIKRRLGAGTAIVACMSGNFVQRGDFAVVNKFARAEMALAGGADLVLELPTPWSAAAAERFAQGGAALLKASGVVTHLAFGCECGSPEPLLAAAEGLESSAYQEKLRELTDTGISFAAARQRALLGITGAAECLSAPNNALAVEYLRALKALNAGMEPLALPRTGAGHDSLVDSVCPSAGAVRKMLAENGDWQKFLPEASAVILSREIAAGRGPVRLENCQRAVLSQLRRMDEEEFRVYDGGGEGLYHRFFAAVRMASDCSEILRLAKTKRYPLARLRRMLLHCYLGVPQAAQGETPSYIRVLGANARGRALLAEMRKSASLPVVTKPGHIRRLPPDVQRSFRQEARCTDLYSLAYPDGRQSVPDAEYRSSPVIR